MVGLAGELAGAFPLLARCSVLTVHSCLGLDSQTRSPQQATIPPPAPTLKKTHRRPLFARSQSPPSPSTSKLLPSIDDRTATTAGLHRRPLLASAAFFDDDGALGASILVSLGLLAPPDCPDEPPSPPAFGPAWKGPNNACTSAAVHDVPGHASLRQRV